MNDFFLITKINLLDFFDIRRIINFKYKKERKKNILRITFFLAIIVLLFIYFYKYFNKILPDFLAINKEFYVLLMAFLFLNIFIFLYNLLKVRNSLFNYKDYYLLASLPIKRRTIIASKFFSLYLLNLGITLLIMLPALIACNNYFNISILVYLFMIVIPIIPLCFSIIVGVILSIIINNFKNHNVISYLMIGIIIFGILLLLLFNTSSKIFLNQPSLFINIVDYSRNFFFYLNNYLFILKEMSFNNIFLFLLYPLIVCLITIIFVDKNYDAIRSKIVDNDINDNYNIKKYSQNSVFISLYKKELRKISSNSLYIINSLFGCIMIILVIFFTLFFGNLMNYFSMNNLKYGVMVFVAFLSMISSTTHASISLEGKSFWIIKSLPIKEMDILKSKIFVNLTFLIPTILLSLLYFGISLKMNVMELFMLLLLPLAYALLTSNLGLLLNLLFPRFSYQNDLKVLTQSTPVLFNVFIGISFLLFPLIFIDISMKYVIINTVVVLIINFLLAVILYYYGPKRIKML